MTYFDRKYKILYKTKTGVISQSVESKTGITPWISDLDESLIPLSLCIHHDNKWISYDLPHAIIEMGYEEIEEAVTYILNLHEAFYEGIQ